MAPMSSTIDAAVRNTRNSTGTRLPSITMSAIANAVSVAIGMPQPWLHAPAGITSAYRPAGTAMPPSAAAIGNAARRRFASRPTVNSRLISSPTSRKKIVSRPSFTQCVSDMRKRASANSKPRGASQNAAKAGPTGELTISTARIDIASSSTPVDGAQLAKSTAADWTRWPSEPSNASDSDT